MEPSCAIRYAIIASVAHCYSRCIGSVMTYKTIPAVLHPDGKPSVPLAELPERPVRVIVTFMDADESAILSEIGDYEATLADYEDRLGRGEIQWQ